MKKIYFIFIIILSVCGILFTSVYGANTKLSFTGSKETKVGSTNTITVQLNSSNKIGGILGVIEKSANISNIKLIAKNGWNIMSFNEQTGSFNMVKNEGAQNEAVMDIEYTVSNNEGKGNIEIKELTVSEITNYDEEEIESISAEITIKKQTQDDSQNTTPQNTTPQNTTPQNTTPQNTTPQNTTPQNTTIKNTTVQNTPSKNVNSASTKTVLPKTGIEMFILPVAIILVCSIAGGMYLRFKKYRDIK